MASTPTPNDDDIDGTSGKDQIDALAGHDVIDGLAGNDVLSGGTGNDILRGGIGADALDGGLGNDEVVGGAGDDEVAGGEGNDLLKPGAGSDLVLCGAGYDVVDYTTSSAAISINLKIGTASGGYADGDTLTETGSGTPAPPPEEIRASGFDDELIGDFGSETLLGMGGNDTLAGAEGDDRLIGGAGQDRFIGGDGTDTVSYLPASMGVTVDLVAGGTSGAAAGDVFTEDLLGRPVVAPENLAGSTHDDTLSGDSRDNRLEGVGGNDVLEGRGGDDRLTYTAGRDTLDGGLGEDTVDLIAASEAVWLELDYGGSYQAFTRDGSAQGLDSGTWHAAAEVARMENIRGTSYDDKLRGDDRDNEIRGLEGDDTIEGAGGDDSLRYDSGDAVSFDGGAGTDTVDFLFASEAIWADLGYAGQEEAFTRDGAQGNVDSGTWKGIASITNVKWLRGSDYDDELRGDGDDNVVDGRGGADVLEGAGGRDRLVADTGDTAIDVLRGGAGANIADFDGFKPVWVDLAYIGREQAFTRGASDLTTGSWNPAAELHSVVDLHGTVGDDKLYGDARDNQLRDEAGADLVQGRGGDDLLEQSTTWDRVDKLSGGSGADGVAFTGDKAVWAHLDYAGAEEVFTRGAGGLSSGTWTAIADLSGIESLVGTRHDDDLRGDAGANRLSGGSGDDILEGAGGDDRLTGDRGDDRLSGGGGADLFSFAASDGTHRITDWQDGSDQLDLRVFDLTSFSDVEGKVADTGAGLVFNLAGGTTVTLVGVNSGTLDSSDVIL